MFLSLTGSPSPRLFLSRLPLGCSREPDLSLTSSHGPVLSASCSSPPLSVSSSTSSSFSAGPCTRPHPQVSVPSPHPFLCGLPFCSLPQRIPFSRGERDWRASPIFLALSPKPQKFPFRSLKEGGGSISSAQPHLSPPQTCPPPAGPEGPAQPLPAGLVPTHAYAEQRVEAATGPHQSEPQRPEQHLNLLHAQPSLPHSHQPQQRQQAEGEPAETPWPPRPRAPQHRGPPPRQPCQLQLGLQEAVTVAQHPQRPPKTKQRLTRCLPALMSGAALGQVSGRQAQPGSPGPTGPALPEPT